jgi:RimJ/RimL family protein N-acetyltransferase
VHLLGNALPDVSLNTRAARVIDLGQGGRTERLDLEPLAVGTVQATLPAGGPPAGPAEVAWVLAREAQGRGYAREAARSLVARLQAAGWTVIAHVHPGHLASQGVARAAGLSPTEDVHDGEVRWAVTPAQRGRRR